MSCYALDTNIVSYLLRGDKEIQERIYYEVKKGEGLIILPIVYYEVKRGLIDKNALVKFATFERLCSMFGIDCMDTKTLDIAANIYADRKQKGQQIEDADILIAASCVAHEYILVTNNERHFLGINGLKITNWLRESLPSI